MTVKDFNRTLTRQIKVRYFDRAYPNKEINPDELRRKYTKEFLPFLERNIYLIGKPKDNDTETDLFVYLF